MATPMILLGEAQFSRGDYADTVGTSAPIRKTLVSTQTSAATHIPISNVLRTDAAATDTEIPVPSAMYAAKHAGHLGSNARISVGTENFASTNLRRLADDGWDWPSAALLETLPATLTVVWQQVSRFICDSHSRSRTQLLSAPPQSLADTDHDGGPMTSKTPSRLRRDL